MQLRRLELYGFKSFANKTVIEFGRGITAIVGPNGSGKSNITDAIKWVLGEQNPRNIRGLKTEDIIFAGTVGRKALNIAEVSLVFDNADSWLPIEFKEVTVTRRLFRSGESEYFINRARCRLKDIYELFADTGLGRDAVSVISQNKIDFILNARPEERRLLFEEVAGITKYRDRKKEALKKLEYTKQNLLRVTDIIGEVKNQLIPLTASAAKTRQYDDLARQLTEYKISLLVNRYDSDYANLDKVNAALLELTDEKSRLTADLHMLDATKERFNVELLSLEQSVQAAGRERDQLEQKIAAYNQERSIMSERHEHDKKDRLYLSEEAVQAQRKITAAKERQTTLENELAAEQTKLAAAAVQLQEQQRQANLLNEQITGLEEQLTHMKEQALIKLHALSELEGNIGIMRQRRQQLIEQQAEKSAARRALQQNIAATDEQRDKLTESLQSLLRQMEAEAMQLSKLEQKLAGLDRERGENAALTMQYKHDLAVSESQLNIIGKLQQDREGFSYAARSILNCRLDWRRSICGAVAELLMVPPEYVTAIEVVLGGSLQNIVVDDDVTAQKAIEFLKRERHGRATFLPLNILRRKSRPPIAYLETPGIVGRASQLIECETKYRVIVEHLLNNTLVMTDLAAALTLAKDKRYGGLRLVTLAGEVINPSGSITGGSIARKDNSYLSRKKQLDELNTNIAELTKQLAERHNADQLLARRKSELESDAAAKRRRYQQYELQKAEFNIRLGNAEQALLGNNAQLRQLDGELASYAEQLSQLDAGIAEQQYSLAEFKANAAAQGDDESQAARRLGELTTEKNRLNELILQQNIAKTVLEQAAIRIAGEVTMTVTHQNENIAKLAELNEKLTTIDRRCQIFIEQYQQYENDIKSCVAAKQAAQIVYDECYNEKFAKLTQIQEQDQQLKEVRRREISLQNKIEQSNIAAAKLNYQLDTYSQELRNSFAITWEQARSRRISMSNRDLETGAAKLLHEIDSLGPINHNAPAELAALEERRAFMESQAEDLQAASGALHDIIKKIDLTMSEQFKAAFAKVREYFQDLFGKLFGGGKADLLMTGDDVLASGVDIIVQPPEKKQQKLAALSGGERALTVVALLFAFLKFKPAPFTVVDEIDAPLDESNIGRFSEFLKEYALKTQFIIVTHRKGTMQAADVMHGITVEDRGVSNVISVKLADKQ